MTDQQGKPTNKLSTNKRPTDKMTTALNGQYSLTSGLVIKEAWQLTTKNFARFAPAIAIFIAVSILIMVVIANTIVHPTTDAMQELMRLAQEQIEPQQALLDQVLTEIKQFGFIYLVFQILITPLHASLLLMGLNHSIGGVSLLKHLMAGFYKTLPLILMFIMNLVLQMLSSVILPFASIYLAIAFSMAPLLICERGLSPLNALWISFKAVNKKIFAVLGINLFIFVIFMAAALFWGVGIILALPLYVHLQAVLYRNMFGLAGLPNQDNEPDNDPEHKNDNHAQEQEADQLQGQGSDTFEA